MGMREECGKRQAGRVAAPSLADDAAICGRGVCGVCKLNFLLIVVP